MKYINSAILVLGLLIGAIVGYNIPLGNGNVALIGGLLVPAFGFVVAFLIKKRYQAMSLEESAAK